MDRFKKGNKCVFCRSYGVDLHSPKDQDSFNIIIQSALTRNDDVIKSLQNSELRDIFYHADCRKTYVHKKTLRNYDSDNPKKAKLCSYEDDDMPSERMSREKCGNKCVFCLTYGVDLHSPKDQDSFNIIIKSAVTRNDDVIKSLQNSELRDIFYHADCRKTYVHKKTLQKYDSDDSMIASKIFILMVCTCSAKATAL